MKNKLSEIQQIEIKAKMLKKITDALNEFQSEEDISPEELINEVLDSKTKYNEFKIQCIQKDK